MPEVVFKDDANSKSPVIVLGLDPSLRSTGFGVVASYSASLHRALDYGVIRTPANMEHGRSLLFLQMKLEEIIVKHRPNAAAIEKTIFVQNHSVAITLGVARGAILVLLAKHAIPVFDYPPRSIKSAATGSGAAGKKRIAVLVRAQLGLQEIPTADAADALAAALTHAQRHFSTALLQKHSYKRNLQS